MATAPDAAPKISPFSRPGQYLVYLSFRAVELVLGVLPIGFIARFGEFCGSLAYHVAGKYRKLALHNLRIAYGRESTEAERRAVAKRHFTIMAGDFLCSLKMPLMKEEDILPRVRVEGAHHATAVRAEGNPLLYAITHMSCWELLTQVPSAFTFGTHVSTIYQPLSNPFLEAHLRKSREKMNYAVFSRDEGFAAPMKHLRDGNTTLGLLVDQHAGDKGVWCPVFDRLASTTPLACLIARKLNIPLLPLSIYNEGPARWRISIQPPLQSGEAKPTVEGMTAAMNQVVERMVRVAPENNFWVHNRWKTPKPAFLLQHYHRGTTLPQGYDPANLQRFELIIRSPNWLGDACMAFPAVRALRAGRPDLRITVFTPAKLAQLWQSLGIIDEIITKDGKEGLLSVVKRLKQTGRRYDAGILFTNSTRSTLEFWLAGIPRLVGFKGSLRSKFMHQIVPEQKTGTAPEHQANKYLRLAKHCGADISSPALFATGAIKRNPDGIIRIGICAGAEYGQAKRWPLERFAEVANAIPHVEWVLFGAPGEKAMGEQLASMLKGQHLNLVGKTSLDDLIECLRECSLLVTNDTGTMHLAAALGVPTVTIFGSTEPILTGPLGAQHTIVRHHVPCSPCFKRECPFGHYDCMTGVSSAQVTSVVLQRLSTL